MFLKERYKTVFHFRKRGKIKGLEKLVTKGHMSRPPRDEVTGRSKIWLLSVIARSKREVEARRRRHNWECEKDEMTDREGLAASN